MLIQGYTRAYLISYEKCTGCGKELDSDSEYPATVYAHISTIFNRPIVEYDYGYFHEQCWNSYKKTLDKFGISLSFENIEDLLEYGRKYSRNKAFGI